MTDVYKSDVSNYSNIYVIVEWNKAIKQVTMGEVVKYNHIKFK